ncbi:10784_t:CDS:2, partial [Funneliformis geosporum]
EHREARIAIGDMRNAASTTSTIEYDFERKHEDLREEIMDRDELYKSRVISVRKVTIEDQETDANKLDEIVVTKNLDKSNRAIKEKRSTSTVCYYLSNWTKVEWSRILKVLDYSQLFIKSRKKLCKDKIDENQSLSDLKSWGDKFTNLEPSEDAKLTVSIIEFFCLCLRREINILTIKHREQDYVVKILSPIIGFLIKEFNIGTFELNWIEKSSRSVTRRK